MPVIHLRFTSSNTLGEIDGNVNAASAGAAIILNTLQPLELQALRLVEYAVNFQAQWDDNETVRTVTNAPGPAGAFLGTVLLDMPWTNKNVFNSVDNSEFIAIPITRSPGAPWLTSTQSVDRVFGVSNPIIPATFMWRLLVRAAGSPNSFIPFVPRTAAGVPIPYELHVWLEYIQANSLIGN